VCEYTFSLFLSASQAFFQLYKFHPSMARMPNLSAKKMQGRSIFVIGRKKERHTSKTPLLCDCVDIKGSPQTMQHVSLFSLNQDTPLKTRVLVTVQWTHFVEAKSVVSTSNTVLLVTRYPRSLRPRGRQFHAHQNARLFFSSVQMTTESGCFCILSVDI